jgi:hypothetical protein
VVLRGVAQVEGTRSTSNVSNKLLDISQMSTRDYMGFYKGGVGYFNTTQEQMYTSVGS